MDQKTRKMVDLFFAAALISKPFATQALMMKVRRIIGQQGASLSEK